VNETKRVRGDTEWLLARYLLLAVGAVLLNFFLPRLLPGDPLAFNSDDSADAAVPLSATAREQLRDYYDLDEPLGWQLLNYLTNLASGDLGWSIARSAPVSELILDRLPWTLALTLTAVIVSALAGSALGMLAGWAPGRVLDRALISLAAVCAALPEFLVAIGLLMTLAVGFGWFPLFGGRTIFANYPAGLVGALRHGIDVAWHLALPATALVITGTSAYILLARDATARLRHEPWLVVARAKGLRERDIARRHALPNIALPLLTFFGLRLGGALGGALIVERVFHIPGLGLLTYQAIRARDYPVLQAVFLLSSVGVLVVNLAVELLYLRVKARQPTVTLHD
jgi:peptide/nickel transport system permease protein